MLGSGSMYPLYFLEGLDTIINAAYPNYKPYNASQGIFATALLPVQVLLCTKMSIKCPCYPCISHPVPPSQKKLLPFLSLYRYLQKIYNILCMKKIITIFKFYTVYEVYCINVKFAANDYIF